MNTLNYLGIEGLIVYLMIYQLDKKNELHWYLPIELILSFDTWLTQRNSAPLFLGSPVIYILKYIFFEILTILLYSNISFLISFSPFFWFVRICGLQVLYHLFILSIFRILISLSVFLGVGWCRVLASDQFGIFCSILIQSVAVCFESFGSD